MGTTGLVPGAGINKEESGYRQHEKCLSCVHFYGPNSCDIVDGNISPEAVCNRWEVKETSRGGKDGEFYKEQYERGTKYAKDLDESGAGFYVKAYERKKK